MPKRQGKVAIVGFCETTRDLAPFNDPSFQIWGCNHLYPYIPRWDRWFDVHDPEWSRTHLVPSVWAEHEAFLRKDHGRPIFMLKTYPEYPSSVALPVDHLIKRFGRRYFTSAISYQIALAIDAGVAELHVYGVDMRHDTEYGAQKPCAEFWLGIAQGMGIKVVIPEASALLGQGDMLYGFEEQAGTWAECERAAIERLQEAQKERASWSEKQDRAVATIHTWDGVLQEARRALESVEVLQRGARGEQTAYLTSLEAELRARVKDAEESLAKAHQVNDKAIQWMHTWDGVIQENQQWINRFRQRGRGGKL